MELETINALKKWPAATGQRMLTVKEYRAEILRKETQLGIPPSRPVMTSAAGRAVLETLDGIQQQRFAGLPLPSVAKAAAPSHLDFATLRALHSGIFTENATTVRLENAGWAMGSPEQVRAATEHTAARKAYDAVIHQHEKSPARVAARENLAKVAIAIRERQRGSESDQYARLAQDFAKAGISVPGLRLDGIKVSLSDAAARFSPEQRRFAQAQVADFFAMIGNAPDVAKLAEVTPLANAARDLLKQSGRLDRYGNLTL